jgi:hypothetical protein
MQVLPVVTETTHGLVAWLCISKKYRLQVVGWQTIRLNRLLLVTLYSLTYTYTFTLFSLVYWPYLC